MKVENSRMIYRGSDELARAYRGDHVIVWEPGSGKTRYDEMYLTLEVVDTQTGGTLNFKSYTEPTYVSDLIQISRDGGNTWVKYIYATQAQKTLQIGDTVLIKGDNITLTHNDVPSQLGILNADYIVYGNSMSLLYGDSFTGKTELTGSNDECFLGLFIPFGQGDNCVSAKDLVLPATKLSDSCYMGMFKNSALRFAPDLPATTLAESCYKQMFENTELEIAPELPATALTRDCYWSMFAATNITKSPILKARRLVDGCYQSMFMGCENLNYITCLSEYNAESSTTSRWVYGVASAGTFISSFEMNEWTIGQSGIPSGWTGNTTQVINEYTTIEAITGGYLYFREIDSNGNVHIGSNLYYSRNGGPWVNGRLTSALILEPGEKVKLKAYYSERNSGNMPTFSGSTCSFNVYGNALSMTEGDNFIVEYSNREKGFPYLFINTNVVSAKNFILPNGHYMRNEFSYMFYGCTGLTEAPTIRGSYADENSMVGMFEGCTNLDKIVSYLTYIDSTATTGWLRQVSQTGEFYKPLSATYQTGENGIPSDWLVYIL